MSSDYFGNYQFPYAGPESSTAFSRTSSICSPSEDNDNTTETICGSAHVSVEIREEELQYSGPVMIQADCTDPPWMDQEMLYCGRTSTSRHLYTMLYDNISTRPVHFQMRAGEQAVVEPTFYEQCRERDGSISHVVEPWAVLDSGMLTPTESERPPLLPHERVLGHASRASVSSDPSSLQGKGPAFKTHESWRRHRRQASVSITQPLPSIESDRARLTSIVEEMETATIDSVSHKPLSQKDHRKDSGMELVY